MSKYEIYVDPGTVQVQDIENTKGDDKDDSYDEHNP